MPYSGPCTATGSQGSLDDLDIPCSPSSFASLPRPTPLLDFLSQDAMIGDVVVSTRQNAEVWAQMDQNRPTPAGASVSREQSATRSSSTSSVARQASPSTDQQRSQQVRCLLRTSRLKVKCVMAELIFFNLHVVVLTFAHILSVCLQRSSTTEIEQKLQELNRQTAEARAKLFELIEQQKQSSSLRVSPAISPVPHHPSSTYTGV